MAKLKSSSKPKGQKWDFNDKRGVFLAFKHLDFV
jgi:hypothetical protein